MRSLRFLVLLISISSALLSSHAAEAQFSQQGPKLLGADAIGSPEQGTAITISADGNTALVGGLEDNGDIGAAWVYTRSAGVWTQQGNKLVGTGATGPVLQGLSVAVSGDGNTAVVGGPSDNFNTGATWIFTRSAGVWTQQGAKLVGTIGGQAMQGSAVAISEDGSTVIAGGYNDSAQIGAAWIFTRNGATWTQQGAKLIGTGMAGITPRQGAAVALSADGNTAIVGGYGDDASTGAAWVYARDNTGVWSQQGDKLTGTGAVGTALQGFSVSLSADGNTAIVGGKGDNAGVGAAWVYTRSEDVWTQQGLKLLGADAAGVAQQGCAVALFDDGSAAVVGGFGDNVHVGAAWVFTRSAGVWTQRDTKLVGSGAVGLAEQGYAVAVSDNGQTVIIGGRNDNSSIGAAWVFAAVTPPPVLTVAVSRKMHGSAGTFDLPLSGAPANPTTEPRRGPGQTIVFTFDKAITDATATITEGTALAAAPTFNGNQVIVGLTGVTDQQYVTVSLTNVASSDGGSGGSGSVRLGFLVGDVNQNRVVTVADLGLVNAQLAQLIKAANFLEDVNASGTLSVADKGITNANLTRALQAP